jgi:hypothetical protein
MFWSLQGNWYIYRAGKFYYYIFTVRIYVPAFSIELENDIKNENQELVHTSDHSVFAFFILQKG